jgi:hypothetical protein
LDGRGNIQNTRKWSAKNPDFTKEDGFKSTALNVWCGLWAGGIIGPFFFEGSINGRTYLDMLSKNVWPALQNIPSLSTMYFEQDGAPPHWSKKVRAWLDLQFPQRWIGRDGPIVWPARSPDITPMDFSLFGTIKNRIYAMHMESLTELRSSIIVEFGKLDIDYCQKTCQHVIKRLEKCKELGGAQIERVIN